jgi:hypothetical protein
MLQLTPLRCHFWREPLAQPKNSPLELPPRTSDKERPRSQTDAVLEPSIPLTSMPISFGVFILGLIVSCLLCVLLSGAAHGNANALAQQASRASERRLAKELMQLKAAATGLQEQLDARAHDIAGQAREIERLNAELKAVRVRAGLEGRSARARRSDAY